MLPRLKPVAVTFTLVKVDSYRIDTGYVWNDIYTITRYKTTGNDYKGAFLRALKKRGIRCNRGFCKVEDFDHLIELRERSSGRPLYAALMAMEDEQ